MAPGQELTSNTFIQLATIKARPDAKWQPAIAQQCVVGLFAVPAPLTLLIRATDRGITWQVEAPYEVIEMVERNLYGLYPEVDIAVGDKTQADVDAYTFRLLTAAPFVGPLQHADGLKDIDPLSGVVTAMSNLRSDEVVVYSLTLNPPSQDYYKIGSRYVTQSAAQWWQFLTPRLAVEAAMFRAMLGIERRVPKYVPDIQRQADHKLRMPLKEVDFVIKVMAATRTRAEGLAALLAPGLAVFDNPGLNFLVPEYPQAYRLVLSAPELAALWHLPSKDCRAPGILWATDASVPLPPELDQVQEGVVLGWSSYQGRTQVVRLPTADRITHVNLIGRTRVGKSTLLHHLIDQDIAAGRGVGVIDPHGDLVEEILTKSIPPKREKDVVLLDMAESEKIIGLNLLDVPEGAPVETAASLALALLKHFSPSQWNTGRTEDALYAALVSLMSVPGSVIQDVPRLFSDRYFRDSVVRQVTDPVTLEYWQYEFDPVSAAQQRELARPVSNRVRHLYRERKLRQIIGQSDSLDFRQILAGGKIFLASLRGAAALHGNTIGSLLVSKFQMAAMSRATDPRSARRPYYLYIDEVQNFVTTSLPVMLSEAAKYGLVLVIANQFLGQLGGETLKAVQGNVGTTIMFRSSQQDAEAFAPLVEPRFSRDDLMELSRFKAIIKLQVHGQTLPAFVVSTYPPPPVPKDGFKAAERIRRLSRDQYGKPVAEIDAEQTSRLRQATTDLADQVQTPPPPKTDTDIEEIDFFG